MKWLLLIAYCRWCITATTTTAATATMMMLMIAWISFIHGIVRRSSSCPCNWEHLLNKQPRFLPFFYIIFVRRLIFILVDILT
ncbi:hypothetical protein BDA99DRAFT_492473 [Phascolomyces articulosus]|uniref:Uncharacterized protein n=1 Tax=Phascolomyces articulosus TaxID=60185 RepID=A0AAD5KQF2_9FUNG|nr:hypothetical protein BDA99DRAFT_492473 [Phascolomyces articulosus]